MPVTAVGVLIQMENEGRMIFLLFPSGLYLYKSLLYICVCVRVFYFYFLMFLTFSICL